MNPAWQSRRLEVCCALMLWVFMNARPSAAQSVSFQLADETDSSAQPTEIQDNDSPEALQTQTGGSPNAASQPAAPAAAKNSCMQPAQVFMMQEYSGPFKNLVGYFVRQPEIKTVHLQRGQPGSQICALKATEKLHLFYKNSINPFTFIVSGWNAGWDQAFDNDPSFGQGMAGYGKRYGAALADHLSGDFFHTFVFPVIFKQDPRYYRLGYGTGRQRLRHALAHVFVAHSDAGHATFNYSEWLGTISATALSNTYHPGNERGVGPATQRIAVEIASDAGWDVLREFWPEVVRTFRLPFNVQTGPVPPK